MSRWLNRFQPFGILLLRLILGSSMLYNSWSKVIPAGGFHHSNYLSALQHFNQFVVSLGMPAWLGYVSTFTEFAGGICLIVGLFTRFFAFLVAINMIVAIVTVNIHHGYQGSEYSLALTGIALMLLLAGPGRPALDRRLGLN